MNSAIAVAGIIKLLDLVHDILCPFFRDDHQERLSERDKEKLLLKIQTLEDEIKELKK